MMPFSTFKIFEQHRFIFSDQFDGFNQIQHQFNKKINRYYYSRIKIKRTYKDPMYNFFKKKPSPPETQKSLIEQYHSIKDNIELPLKIKLFLQMLQNNTEERTEKKKIPKEITDVYKPFCKCFTKLSTEEKSYFLLAMAKISQSLLAQNMSSESQSVLEYESKIDKIETSCQIRQFFVGVSHWEQKIFKFNNNEKLIKVCSQNNTKKQIVFHLSQYHLRTSTKQKNTMVLEAVFDTWKISQKYHAFYIYFKDKILFNEIYNAVKNTIIMTWKQRLTGMLNEIEKNNNVENIAANQNGVGVRMLTSKTISDYFKTKQAINKVMTKNSKWKQFSEIRKIKIYRSSKYENLYKTQNIVEHSYDDVLKNIELVNRVPSKKLLHYQKMENFSNSISAVYYKYMVKGCTHEMLCLVEEIHKENECKIVYKAIDNFVMEKNVDFVQIKVQRIGAGKTKVSAFGFINFDQNKKLNPVSVVDFFLSVVEVQIHEELTILKSSTTKIDSTFQVESTKIHEECHDEMANDDEDDFHTVAGDHFDSDEERQLQICNTFESPKKQHMDNLEEFDQKQTQQQRNVINQFRFEKSDNMDYINSKEVGALLLDETEYLRKNFLVIPAALTQNKELIKQHFFIGEWAIYEKGGVYSLNTKMINKQKKVYQSFLTRLGKALMSKKLSNISIPVIALKDESMLESIGRNVSYAPLLLQKLQTSSPIQRMKRAVIFMISMGTIGLGYAKPFNPILGETFQAYIDNCPLYMEQTSHHPPISTLYFKGRGYEIYGSVNPAISLRINSVKCFSEAPFYMKFENKDSIEFRPAKMLVGGLLVGERTFDFCDASYVFDEKNKIIAEVNFGPKKKFGKHYKGDKTDFLWGHIYEVSENFMKKFIKEGKNLSPALQKTSRVCGQIYGCWHEKIYIDQNLMYDFQAQLPCQMLHEKYALRSDSRLRMDIKYLTQEKYLEAQDQKDRLEQIQRADAELRKGHK